MMDRVVSRRRLLTGAGACAAVATGFGFGRATKASPPPVVRPTTTPAERQAVEPDAILRVAIGERVVALSFDDGPDPRHTPTVLDLLERHHVAATFFVVGVNVAAHADLVQHTLGLGHHLANHTHDHPDLELLTPAEVQAEIDGGERAIVAAGAPRPQLFRPPKGLTDEAVGVIADADRYRTVFWDLCVEHFVDHFGVAAGVDRLMTRVRPGSIILAHDGGHIEAPGHPHIDRGPTMAALPVLLDRLQGDGYEVVDVSTLLRRARRRRGAPAA
jgi:peptidoglycan/xylan/chitin deacetylase (PgdA/CDA1 family)